MYDIHKLFWDHFAVVVVVVAVVVVFLDLFSLPRTKRQLARWW